MLGLEFVVLRCFMGDKWLQALVFDSVPTSEPIPLYNSILMSAHTLGRYHLAIVSMFLWVNATSPKISQSAQTLDTRFRLFVR